MINPKKKNVKYFKLNEIQNFKLKTPKKKIMLPLFGLKVVELDSNPISSFCGTILSDFGANVIMINQSKDPQTLIHPEKNFLY